MSAFNITQTEAGWEYLKGENEMGAYKEFIEVTGIDGCKIYIKVASIIGLEDDDPVKLRFGDADTYYRLKDSYEDVKRMLEE